MSGGAPAPGDRAVGLWAFSLWLYARPEVAPSCLALQARCDADVNVLLCALWLGATGRGRLDVAEVASLDAAVRPLREAVVKPLRGARGWLKAELVGDPSLAPLREEIKRLELVAERAEQDRLEAWARDRRAETPSHADALANAVTYLAWRTGKATAVDPASLQPLMAGIAAFLAGAGPLAREAGT